MLMMHFLQDSLSIHLRKYTVIDKMSETIVQTIAKRLRKGLPAVAFPAYDIRDVQGFYPLLTGNIQLKLNLLSLKIFKRLVTSNDKVFTLYSESVKIFNESLFP